MKMQIKTPARLHNLQVRLYQVVAKTDVVQKERLFTSAGSVYLGYLTPLKASSSFNSLLHSAGVWSLQNAFPRLPCLLASRRLCQYKAPVDIRRPGEGGGFRLLALTLGGRYR